MVVLKNCEPELSYVLVELFNKCLKESCSTDCSKVSSAAPIIKNIGEQSAAKTYCPVSLLSVVGKVKSLKNLAREMWTFSDFQYGVRSSQSTADLVSDRIAEAFNRSGPT